MALRGTVKKWFSDKGFGFIDTPDHTDDVFVHFSQIEGSRTTLNLGENVTFCMGMNKTTGKVVAEKVIGDLTGIPAPGPGYPGAAGLATMLAYGGRIPQCFEFQKGGACKFGDTCKFSHGDAGPPAYAKVGGAAAAFGAAYGQPMALQRFSPYGQPGVPAYGGLTPQPTAYGGYGMPPQAGLVYGAPPNVGGYGGVIPQPGVPQPGLGVPGYGQPQAAVSYAQPPAAGGYPPAPVAYGQPGQNPGGLQMGQQPGVPNAYVQPGLMSQPTGSPGSNPQPTPLPAGGYAQQPQTQPQPQPQS